MQVRPLSDSDKSISWRLNDLLRAGEKAKSFAAITWRDSSDGSITGFKSWNPDTSINTSSSEADSGGLLPGNESGQDGLSSPLSFDESMEKVKTEAYEKGFREGEEKEQISNQEMKNLLRNLLVNINNEQKSLTNFFDPLKTLALSIARQIVKGDLTLSEELINRLVKNALEEIDNANEHSLVLEMNPNDIEQLDKSALMESMQVEFLPNKAILRGDIKVKMGDSVIENFIENRLELIAQELFSEEELTAAEEEKLEDQQTGDSLNNEEVNEESVPVSKQDEVNLSDDSDIALSESDELGDGDETK